MRQEGAAQKVFTPGILVFIVIASVLVIPIRMAELVMDGFRRS